MKSIRTSGLNPIYEIHVDDKKKRLSAVTVYADKCNKGRSYTRTDKNELMKFFSEACNHLWRTSPEQFSDVLKFMKRDTKYYRRAKKELKQVIQQLQSYC